MGVEKDITEHMEEKHSIRQRHVRRANLDRLIQKVTNWSPRGRSIIE